LRLFDQQGTQVIKAQLIDRVAAGNTHLRPGDASKTVNIILEVITAALARGDRVEMRGIGTFSVRVRRGRPARNPKTEPKSSCRKGAFRISRQADECTIA
jgi:integration host factor subunit beta